MGRFNWKSLSTGLTGGTATRSVVKWNRKRPDLEFKAVEGRGGLWSTFFRRRS